MCFVSPGIGRIGQGGCDNVAPPKQFPPAPRYPAFPSIPFIQQCAAGETWRNPDADGRCAHVRALQSAFPCAKNVAVLVSIV